MAGESIYTKEAPEAIGPYSQAKKLGNLLFCSGQIPLDPSTMEIVSGGIKEQTRQVCKNIEAVLKAAGTDLKAVVKATCLLKEMSQFAEFNETYAEFFGETQPARAAFEVARLPKDALIEIEVIAKL